LPLSPNQIIKGDCSETLKSFEPNSIHLTCTSPPYYNARDYSNWPDYESYLKFLEDTFTEVFRITKEGRMCVVNISPIIVPREKRSMESSRIAIPYHFFSLMEKIGWKYLDDIIWIKPEGAAPNRNGGFFRHRKPVAYKPNIVTETIFVFQKPSSNLIDKIVRSYDGDILESSLVADGYERSNVWKFNPETRSKHSAPYPEDLTERVVSYYSYVGDMVLDPFMGSGTTAVTCKKLGRNYIGCELHDEYIEMANERLEKIGEENE
jgi:DNA modification methylase